MPITETITETSISIKKIVRLVIDVDAGTIVFTVRCTKTSPDGVELSCNVHEVKVSGADYLALANYVPEASLSMYDNLAAISYAYLQSLA